MNSYEHKIWMDYYNLLNNENKCQCYFFFIKEFSINNPKHDNPNI